MRKVKFLILLVLIVNLVNGQNQSNNWYFGYYAGITFNTTPPSAITGSQLFSNEGCSSISDIFGNLLFYSDGERIWDSSHAIMQNGTGLFGNITTTQSCMILPDPGNSSLFYIVTCPSVYDTVPLAYSIVDMSLNNGLGAVTIKNVPMLSQSTEKLSAVQHQNGIDIWIVAHERQSNNFHSFLLSSAGINLNSIISSVGSQISNTNQDVGYLKISPCGSLLAMATLGGWATGTASRLELFNFDNNTGEVSNALQLGQWQGGGSNAGAYGVEFSPDNSKLYSSIMSLTFRAILQYNLLAGTDSLIIASMDTIASSPYNNFTAMQTGPDGKIYVAIAYQDTLASINNPNALGNACNYTEFSVPLSAGTQSQLGLPSFLSSLYCNIPSANNPSLIDFDISVYPNPFSSEINVGFNASIANSVSYSIFDILGKEIFYCNEMTNVNYKNKIINTSYLQKGIYFLKITYGDTSISKKMIKIN